MLFTLIFITFNTLKASPNELWFRSLTVITNHQTTIRPEYQHRLDERGESINNVFRLSTFYQRQEYFWMAQLGSFHPLGSSTELRPTVGIGSLHHRLIYEQRFFKDTTFARLRYRSHYFLTDELNLYQEIFYQSNSQTFTELRLGLNWVKPLHKNFQLQMRAFAVLMEKNTPHETAFVGLNYLL